MKLEPRGRSQDEIIAELEARRDKDADWRGGRTFSLVYDAGSEVRELLERAYSTFIMENALSPMAFPSLRRLEMEVVAIAGNLFHAPDAAGSMTTGGTESILMAMKTAREWGLARRPGIRPEVVLPITAHPAFEKAAHYLGLKNVHVPVRADFRVSVEAARAAITDETVLVVGSAPPYPHGAVDPIEDLAALALEKGILCHVDACLGGFLLPFLEKLGRPIPPFDFRIPGVTSLSADVHKYGYAAKGASVILYRDAELRKHQYFTYSGWPGGLYASPTMTGTRSGGAIAAAWAVLRSLGEEGYLRHARSIVESTAKLIAGINAIPGLRVLGEPDASVFAFTSDDAPIYSIGQAMEEKGWRLDYQQDPASLHVMVTPAHAKIADVFLRDLAAGTERARSGELAPSSSAAVYGMLAAMPDRSEFDGFLLGLLDSVYTLEGIS